MIRDQVRVDAIRKRVAAGLGLVQQMDVVKDENFQRWLKHTRNWFHDIDSIFIAELQRSERTISDERFWLSHTERFLAIAEQEGARLFELFKKYGPDLRMIG